mmetsp:Transcript_17966/g.35080  ORF Transcript_17966/g.35080 Transcript_17966/m.35080 type:complete len:577 (+) Transcript_17966:457-2187(+)
MWFGLLFSCSRKECHTRLSSSLGNQTASRLLNEYEEDAFRFHFKFDKGRMAECTATINVNDQKPEQVHSSTMAALSSHIQSCKFDISSAGDEAVEKQRAQAISQSAEQRQQAAAQLRRQQEEAEGLKQQRTEKEARGRREAYEQLMHFLGESSIFSVQQRFAATNLEALLAAGKGLTNTLGLLSAIDSLGEKCRSIAELTKLVAKKRNLAERCLTWVTSNGCNFFDSANQEKIVLRNGDIDKLVALGGNLMSDLKELNRENIQICSLEELIPLIQERRNARLDVYQGLLHWFAQHAEEMFMPNDESLQIRTSDLEALLVACGDEQSTLSLLDQFLKQSGHRSFRNFDEMVAEFKRSAELSRTSIKKGNADFGSKKKAGNAASKSNTAETANKRKQEMKAVRKKEEEIEAVKKKKIEERAAAAAKAQAQKKQEEAAKKQKEAARRQKEKEETALRKQKEEEEVATRKKATEAAATTSIAADEEDYEYDDLDFDDDVDTAAADDHKKRDKEAADLAAKESAAAKAREEEAAAAAAEQARREDEEAEAAAAAEIAKQEEEEAAAAAAAAAKWEGQGSGC